MSHPEYQGVMPPTTVRQAPDKAALWDELKAQFWRESQGHQGLDQVWRTTPDADRAREMLDLMHSMEIFGGATVRVKA